jgi:hypothetical protein
MPVLNKKTGQWEDTPKEVAQKNTKKALKTKHAGKTSGQFGNADINELVLQMAKDQGYIN